MNAAGERNCCRSQEIPDKAWADAALAREYNHHAVEHLSKLWQSIRTQTRRLEVTDTIVPVSPFPAVQPRPDSGRPAQIQVLVAGHLSCRSY
jgi:hypothetical protein